MHTLAGKAAKFLGKLGQKLARNLVKDDAHGTAGPDGGTGPKPSSRGNLLSAASPLPDDDDDDYGSGPESGPANGRGTGRAPSGGVKAMVVGMDGCVWAGYKEGQLEKYSACGKLLLRKVRVPWGPELRAVSTPRVGSCISGLTCWLRGMQRVFIFLLPLLCFHSFRV